MDAIVDGGPSKWVVFLKIGIQAKLPAEDKKRAFGRLGKKFGKRVEIS